MSVMETGVGEDVAPPSSPTPYDEFVIVDAPMPDHTATENDDDTLSSRSPERTEKLRALTGMRSSRKPRDTEKTPPKAKAPKRAVPMPRGGFTKELEQLYVGVGMALLLKDPECGTAVIQAAPRCAETLNNLAAQNPAVRRILVALTQSSAIGAVVIAHAPILWALAKHHVPAVRDSGITGLIDGLTSMETETVAA